MIGKIFPFLNWFRGYGYGTLRADALSGLTVALVLIPQSMAYAQLAGLPPYYGLYASFLPPLVAALFGSSRQLATGPVAVVSLMTSASLGSLATEGSQGFIAYAILLALMVGVLQLSLGLLRLGLVVNFLSHPVVNGFTNASAIIIATSQLSKMFNVYVENAEHHYKTITLVIQAAFHYTHWPTLFMGVFAFAIMYGLKYISPRIPNVLVAVLVTTVISWATGFEHNKVVPINSIDSPEAREMISRFNLAAEALPPLAQERIEVNQALENAKAEGDSIGVFKAQHEDRLITFKMEEFKREAQHQREGLRTLLFHALEHPDGSFIFYTGEKVHAQGKKNGRIWRIKLGYKPINNQEILMMGGGEVIGPIPGGLPSLSFPKLDSLAIPKMISFAVIIALLGFMEAISIAKAIAGKTGQRIDPNQELIGQGIANLVGAMSQSYPTSGSFSRSAVNLQAGALTGLSSAFASLAVLIVLLFFTPLLYHLPQSVLASVIMMAVMGLINISGFVHAWEAKWYDGIIAVVTFALTLGFAPHLDTGIMIGVALSVMVFLYKSMRPRIASLSRHEDQALRCAATHSLKECEYIAMVRFDGPLFFANTSYLEDKIMELMRTKKNLKHIVIVSNGINDIDASGEETMSLLVDRIRSAGVDVSLSGVNESVMGVLTRTHFREKIGEDHIHITMEKAIAMIHEETHKGGSEATCPLLTADRIVCA